MAKEIIGIEQTLAQLEGMLAKMSSEETTLEESISLYAKAAELIGTASEDLAKAKVQIEEIDAKMKLPEETDDL